jgi:superfamily II DNA or RNA helicase
MTPLDIEILGLDDDDEDEEPDEEEPDEDASEGPFDEDQLDEAPDDPNAHKRFWFEHATGAGKTVAAMGFVDASRTGGVLILTHRRNLVDQFHGELKDRGYAKRITPALLQGKDNAHGPVTVETYQWFVRNAGKISEAYSIVICDEAHTALGEKTSAAIRAWTGPIFIGMTATGALIARHVTDLFPTQTSRFDLAQAARRGVISPLRCVRIPPGPGVRTIAKVPLRRGEVDTEFDQEMLAEILDQGPFNFAAADLYKTRFNGVPGVVYAAGVKHAYNLAEAFREQGVKAMAVSGETRKRELAEILARYERGDIDVLVNAQLLAEGWNSPRATVCMHLAPTASKRIYQQRVGRVTRRNPGKEAGIVVDFVAPDTKNDDPVVTLHSLLDRDVYRGGAIVVGPVRRGRGRRLRVERRVLPVTSDEDRRIEVFERELWRIAVEHLPYGEQIQWAALAGARVAPSGWRRARAMLHFDREGAIKRAFLLTAVQRNKNPQLRVRALQEIAASRDGEAFDTAIDVIGTWTREERREGTKVMLLALAEKRIGRRDQANAWIWRLASYTRDVHEEYAVQRWPETKRLLGLLVNSSGAAHARNARRLVHAARKQDRRLSAALLAAAIAHTPEGEEILRGARTRLARKPSALSRELLRNFPKSRGRRGSRRRRKKGAEAGEATLAAQALGDAAALDDGAAPAPAEGAPQRTSRRSRTRNGRASRQAAGAGADAGAGDATPQKASPDAAAADEPRATSRRSRSRNGGAANGVEAASADREGGGASAPDAAATAAEEARAVEAIAGAAAALAAARGPKEEPRSRSRARRATARPVPVAPPPSGDEPSTPAGNQSRVTAATSGDEPGAAATNEPLSVPNATAGDEPVATHAAAAGDEPVAAAAAAKPRRSRAPRAVTTSGPADAAPADTAPKPRRRGRAAPAADTEAAPVTATATTSADALDAPSPRATRSRGTTAKAAQDATPTAAGTQDEPAAPAPKRRTTADAVDAPSPRATRSRRTAAKTAQDATPTAAATQDEPEAPAPKRSTTAPAATAEVVKPARSRRTAAKPAQDATPTTTARQDEPEVRRATAKPAQDATPTTTARQDEPEVRRATAKPAEDATPTAAGAQDEPAAPAPPKRRTKAAADVKPAAPAADRKPARRAKAATATDAAAPKPRTRRAGTKATPDEPEPDAVGGGVESAA